MGSSPPLAQLVDVSKSYETDQETIPALDHVSLDVAEGEFVTIVGPNGAGKTTLMRAIGGGVPPAAGRVEYRGRDIGALPSHARARLGIAHVPEGRKVFPSLTVLENLELGSYRRAARPNRATELEAVFALFPILKDRRAQLAGSLSGGQQQMLALGMALMTRPSLLLLDEPCTGLAPIIVKSVLASLRAINERRRTTLVLVEQNVQAALREVERAIVVKTGQIIFDGPAVELAAKEDLWEWF